MYALTSAHPFGLTTNSRWLAVKIGCYALAIACGVAIRLQLRSFAPAFSQLTASGSTPEVERHLRQVNQPKQALCHRDLVPAVCGSRAGRLQARCSPSWLNLLATAVDGEALRFCRQIADQMATRFGIPAPKALGRLNLRWSATLESEDRPILIA